MNDFQAITLVQSRVGPLGAGHDITIQFHGHSVAFHTKLLDERGQRGCFVAGFQFAVHE